MQGVLFTQHHLFQKHLRLLLIAHQQDPATLPRTAPEEGEYTCNCGTTLDSNQLTGPLVYQSALTRPTDTAAQRITVQVAKRSSTSPAVSNRASPSKSAAPGMGKPVGTKNFLMTSASPRRPSTFLPPCGRNCCAGCRDRLLVSAVVAPSRCQQMAGKGPLSRVRLCAHVHQFANGKQPGIQRLVAVVVQAKLNDSLTCVFKRDLQVHKETTPSRLNTPATNPQTDDKNNLSCAPLDQEATPNIPCRARCQTTAGTSCEHSALRTRTTTGLRKEDTTQNAPCSCRYHFRCNASGKYCICSCIGSQPRRKRLPCTAPLSSVRMQAQNPEARKHKPTPHRQTRKARHTQPKGKTRARNHSTVGFHKECAGRNPVATPNKVRSRFLHIRLRRVPGQARAMEPCERPTSEGKKALLRWRRMHPVEWKV